MIDNLKYAHNELKELKEPERRFKFDVKNHKSKGQSGKKLISEFEQASGRMKDRIQIDSKNR